MRKATMKLSSGRAFVKRVGVVVSAFAIMIVGLSFTPFSEANAASAPGVVPKIKVNDINCESATVNWNKASGPVKGYTIYRNGKAIKHVSASTRKYKDINLNASTSYKYYVRAYSFTGKKVRQWYNKKTKKWQSSAPAKSIRGSSRLVNVKRYGKASPTLTIRTGKKTVLYGRVVKPSQFTKKNNYTISFVQKGTACKVCGKGGLNVTVKYSPATGKYSATATGKDYSKDCHHHNGFDVFACNGDHHYTISEAKEKCRWFRSEDGHEINPLTGAEIGTQTYEFHSDNFPAASTDELSSMSYEELLLAHADAHGDGEHILCQGNKKFIGYYFCTDCNKIVIQ